MVDTDHDIPWADDAIPLNAISLTDAYDYVVSLISDHPELLPKFNEHWSETLRKSREEERSIQVDQEAFDEGLEEYWHRRKEANLFLRLEIEAKRLVACTRDPETGDILKLHSDGWIPSDWDDYIPPGIWIDHIIPDDYDAPGPSGTEIHRALRPVFFMRDGFEAWFKGTFGETASIRPTPIVAPSNQSQRFQYFQYVRAHRRAAVEEAIFALWGGPPNGVTQGRMLERINKWLTDHNRQTVHEVTLRRTLKNLRSRNPSQA